jgi:hypothetical protein
MALIVSITQLRVSKRELELHENEMLPLFKVDYEYIKPDSLDYYDTKIVVVSNEGKQIKNFKYDINTYYRFEITNRNLKIETYIPVQGFYFARFNTSNPTGKLFEAFGKGNNRDFYKLYLDCMNLTRNGTYVFIDLVSTFKFSYNDINNKKCVVFLDNGGNEISESDYIKLTEIKTGNFRDSLYHYYDIDSNFIKTNLLENNNGS